MLENTYLDFHTPETGVSFSRWQACFRVVAGIIGGGLHGGEATVTVSDILGHLLQPLDIVWVAPFVLTYDLVRFELDIDIVVVRINEIYSVCIH
jgi:hypothetical protein